MSTQEVVQDCEALAMLIEKMYSLYVLINVPNPIQTWVSELYMQKMIIILLNFIKLTHVLVLTQKECTKLEFCVCVCVCLFKKALFFFDMHVQIFIQQNIQGAM